jgi:hypothetical protein
MARALPARMFPPGILASSRSFVAYCCACVWFASPIVSRSGSFPRMPSALFSACRRAASPDASHPLVLPVLSGLAGCALLSPACSPWLRSLSASPRLVEPSLCASALGCAASQDKILLVPRSRTLGRSISVWMAVDRIPFGLDIELSARPTVLGCAASLAFCLLVPLSFVLLDLLAGSCGLGCFLVRLVVGLAIRLAACSAVLGCAASLALCLLVPHSCSLVRSLAGFGLLGCVQKFIVAGAGMWLVLGPFCGCGLIGSHALV